MNSHVVEGGRTSAFWLTEEGTNQSCWSGTGRSVGVGVCLAVVQRGTEIADCWRKIKFPRGNCVRKKREGNCESQTEGGRPTSSPSKEIKIGIQTVSADVGTAVGVGLRASQTARSKPAIGGEVQGVGESSVRGPSFISERKGEGERGRAA